MEQQKDMGQQKEKKLKNYGRRQSLSMSKSNSSFPPDLVSEILQKLPAKSIVRSRCVSKLWSSITTDPYFINSYETRFSSKPSLLLLLKKSEKLFVFSFPQNPHNESSYSSSGLYQLKYPESLRVFFMESVHGLICFRSIAKGWKSDKAPTIWNPTMKQLRTLPKPKTNRHYRKKPIWDPTTFFLGYDPIEGKHKVVCIPSERFCNECMVLTLGPSSAQELSWRRIKTYLYHKPFLAIHGNIRCINGVLYYKAVLKFGHMKQQVLMSFDVRSEKFEPIIMLPADIIGGLLIAYEGRLAFVHSYYTNNDGIAKLWVLEDSKKKKEWSHKSFHVPFSSYDSSLKTIFQLRGVTDCGEFIYIPSTIRKSSCILYFDPKRDSFRKFVFDGIGNEPFEVVHAFPNHIESLISLKVRASPNPWAFDPTDQFNNILKKLKAVTNPRARFYDDEEEDGRESEEEEDDDEKDIVIETSLSAKRKREEIIQEPKKIKIKNLCKQILKKDGGSMKLKQLKSFIDEQAPSILSQFSSSKDAIAYLKLKLERSEKFVVGGNKISLVSR